MLRRGGPTNRLRGRNLMAEMGHGRWQVKDRLNDLPFGFNRLLTGNENIRHVVKSGCQRYRLGVHPIAKPLRQLVTQRRDQRLSIHDSQQADGDDTEHKGLDDSPA